MNPLVIAGLVAWAASVGTAAWWSYGAGRDAEIAIQAREDKAGQRAAQVAADTAAEAISKIEVKNVTITHALQREVQTREVFRECRSGPDAVRLLNATPGISPASGPDTAAGGQLPASGAAQ